MTDFRTGTRCLWLALFVLMAWPCFAQNSDKPFPSNDEIKLLLTQADRAMEQYKAAINLEEAQFEKSSGQADAVAKDREVAANYEIMSKGMETKPQLFNSRFGFEIVTLLDDAVRNSLLCSTQAAMGIPRASGVSEAQSFLHLAQTCSDASTLLYTVSENAAALYEKYLAAAEVLENKTADVATKCTDILKKNAASQKR
jgi:hypothetical protein